MNNKIADQTVFVPLPVYNILEAFLAGTSDSFLVLDNEQNIVLFNNNFNEFIQSITGKSLVKSASFHSFINKVEELHVLTDALNTAFEKGESKKFSFSVNIETKRWYDVELNPLKEGETIVGIGIGLFETTHKREAEEAVKKSEALFKALIQNSSDIFLLTDHLFRVTYISDAFQSILGYDTDTLFGKTGFGLIHPDDQEAIAVWLAQLMENSSATKQIEFRAKSRIGNWIYIEVTGQNMLKDEHVASLVFTMRDIQAKKIADQALITAEQRLTLLLNNSKESFIILNNGLRVTAYNKAAQENAPYFFKTELQSGLVLLDLIDASKIPVYISLLEEVMEGIEKEMESSFTDEDGQLHIYQHTFRRLGSKPEQGIFITSSDITERKQAELALKDNEEKFKTIIEYSFDAVAIIDINANITYASPSITNLLGYIPEELIGKNCFEFIHREDAAHVQAKLVSIIANIEESYVDYRSTTKEGGLKWLEAKGKNMFDNKHIRGVLISLRDVSERKRLHDEQTKLTEELRKYNKDLQQFSFITSHNLRAPVANLISLLALYNHTDPADPFNVELMKRFNECAEKLNDTLNDLVNVLVIRSKPNADKEYIEFESVVKKVHKNIGALMDSANGDLIYDFSEVEGIEYNRVHLESIFLNLISNSIKYSSPDRQLQISIRSEKTAKGTRVDFTDNGIGIDLVRYGDRIFGLYQRFNSSKDGKGLGLYMIKSQITATGGEITVQSEAGKGSTFSVFFRDDP